MKQQLLTSLFLLALFSIYSTGAAQRGTFEPTSNLLSFKASWKAETKSCLVEWITSEEIYSSHFELERSMDSVHWEHAISVLAKGGSGPIYYSIVDSQLAYSAKMFYRLRQIDVDGSVSLTSTSHMSRPSRSSNLLFSPNPFFDRLTIRTSVPIYSVELLTLKGELVYQFTPQEIPYTDIVTLTELDIIPPGDYQLKVVSSGGTYIENIRK
ncbi:MAG: T9SS type A sorting domain-containing protein [Bacteroidota bacterium]